MCERILITGGAGINGSYLARERPAHLDDGAALIDGDVRDRAAAQLERVLEAAPAR